MDSLPNLVSAKELIELDHETKITSLPPTPSKSTAFTVDFDDMNNNLLKNNPKKKLDIRDSIKKFVPPKLEKLIKSRVKEDKVKQKNSTEKFDYLVDKGNNPNLSDGAYFLIQKMLFSEPVSNSNNNFNNKPKKMTNENQEKKEFYSDTKALNSLRFKNYNSNNSLKSPTTIEMDSGVCADELDLDDDFSKIKNDDDNNSNEDALSETGTYTVDLDKSDPIAEEARKRINEIFGESSRPKKINQTDCGLSSSSSSKSKHSFKISNVKKDSNVRQVLNRTRHNSERSNASLKVKPNKNLELNKFCSSNEKINKEKRSSCSLNKKEFSKTSLTKKSQLNQNINLINQNNTFVFNCNNEPNSLLNRARANSVTRSFTKIPNKNDLDNQFEEKCSVKSEDASTADSTDLSSINSEKYKSDTCQTSNLRFNRAFALRRARLGIDTPPIISNKTTVNKNSSSSKNQNLLSNTNKPASRSSSQCSTSAYFDRSDGGRFSLRTPKSISTANTSSSSKIINKGNNLKSNESSNLLKAISRTSSLIKKNKNASAEKLNSDLNYSNIKTHETKLKSSNHIRANSFGGSVSNENIGSKPRLSSAASTSSNTISNASTSEDLSVLSDTINVKSLKHLSPHQLGRRIYSTKPYYIAQTNSYRIKLEENNQSLNTSKNDLNQSNKFAQQLSENENNSLPYMNNEKKSSKFGNLNIFNQPNNSSKSLSSLDYLVLSAVHQLSFKLRCKLRSILDTEKSKYPIDNENRILIEELLPQVSVSEFRNSDTSEKTISRDLSNVLKNLKRIEQSLEVINLLLESNSGFMEKSINDSVNDLVRGMNKEFDF